MKIVMESGAYMVFKKPLKREDIQSALLKASNTLKQAV
jgi:hypothetical protein